MVEKDFVKKSQVFTAILGRPLRDRAERVRIFGSDEILSSTETNTMINIISLRFVTRSLSTRHDKQS